MSRFLSTSQLPKPYDYNGRVTSSKHFIFDGAGAGDTGLIIDLDGLSTGKHQIGPELYPRRDERLEI